jgi:hypothetical protein
VSIDINGPLELAVTKRRGVQGWKVRARYPWQERGKIHHVNMATNGTSLYCDTCDQTGCLGVLVVQRHLAAGSAAPTLQED